MKGKLLLSLLVISLLIGLPVVSAVTSVAGTYIKVNELRPDTGGYIRVKANLNGTGYNITMDELIDSTMSFETPTYTSIQDWASIIQSSGYVSGGVLSGNGGATINVTGGQGFIRATNDGLADVMFFDFPASNNLAITEGVTNYIMVDYNGGTPEVQVSLTQNPNGRTRFGLGKTFYRDGETHIVQGGLALQEMFKRMQGRENALQGDLVRTSGMAISDIGNQNVQIDSGVYYAGYTRGTTTTFNSSANTFEYYYYNNSEWVEYDSNQIDILQYNDVSGVGALDTLSNNHYGVHWIYMDLCGHVSVVFGQDSYSKLSDAEDATVPSVGYGHIADMSVLIGRIIVQKSVVAFVAVESAFETTFNPSIVTSHSDLSNLDYASSGHTGFAADDGDTLTGNYKIESTATSGNDLWVFRNKAAASTDRPVVFIEQDNAGDDQPALQIQQDGAGYGIYVDQNGAIPAIHINQDGDSGAVGALNIVNTANNGVGLNVYSNEDGDVTNPLVFIEADNVAFDQPALRIQNDGTAQSIYATSTGVGGTKKSGIHSFWIGDTSSTAGYGAAIDANINSGSGTAIRGYMQQGATGSAGWFYSNVDATVSNPLVFIEADNTAFDQPALKIQQDGTGAYILLDTGAKITSNSTCITLTSPAGTGVLNVCD